MTMTKTKRQWLEQLEQEIRYQERWIEEHGGSLLGYVTRYGSKDDPKHFGNGGEAIFAADTEYLADLRERLETQLKVT